MAHTLRLVLDTNVLLSGVAYPGSIPGKILTAWRNGSVEVVLSPFILDELRRVLPRLKHRHGLSAADMDDLVDALSFQAEVIEAQAEVGPEKDLRDANDQPILATLLNAQRAGGADYLITGDKDLLALADRFAIITPAAHGGPGSD
jgi:putative PIN family toxin of toxin-antitoxin system